SFRAVFLFKYPGLFNKSLIRKGLESVPSSLLVALVIPFTFFVEGNFVLLRNEVYAVLLTVLVLWYLKRPGLSLIITIICLFGFNFVFNVI
ncbi:MAG: AzlD domain-containing protein, partial [Candidatus Hodarchaeales archaeon]